MIAKANRRHHRAMGHQLRVECRRIAYRRNCQHGLSTQCIDGRSPNAIHLGKLGGVEVNNGARHADGLSNHFANNLCPVQ